MGATSVTGVGQGSAMNAGGVKGPHNLRDQYVTLFGPHIVMADKVTLVAGVATVVFPVPLSGSGSGYGVFLTAINGAVNANETVVSAKTDNGDGDFASFAIAGTAAEVVQWMVVKNGQGA